MIAATFAGVPTDGSVTATKLAAASVGTAALVDAAVTNAKLAGSAVTSAKIAAGAVTEAKLAAGLVSLQQPSISGCVPSSGADSDHDIAFTAGNCVNAVGDQVLTLPAYTKQFDAAFAEGDAAGGLGDGVSLPTSGTLHIFAITKDTDGTVDYFGDTSSSGANVPSDMDIAIGLTLGVEGDWSDHPADPGGRTKFGITNATYRRAVSKGIVADNASGVAGLTVAEATKIYQAMYWAVAGAALPRGLNALVFDIEVNSGRGGRTLQNALNAVFGMHLKVDGAIGPATHAGVRQALLQPDGLYKLMGEVDARRDWWWDRLKINRTFGFGWNRRGSRVLIHAVRMACGDL